MKAAPTKNIKALQPGIIGERTGSGTMNVAPAISPDGTKIAFLSERDRLSIDLYLAEATTGKILGKLISTAADPHFESLQFLQSAGAWDAQSKRLAIGTVKGGRPVLAIVDAASGDIRCREIKFEAFGEIFQPTWAPDGNSIAFSAQTGGFTDLFVYDLNVSQTKRLTNDAFADLQPAWSPDGTRLAFVTDRFAGDLGALGFGNYSMAFITVADSAIAPIETGLNGPAINPQWSGDGSRNLFVGESNGRRNLWRLDLTTKETTQLTNELTGVAGITPLSPASPVATGASLVAVNVFRDSGYEIRVLDPSDADRPDPTTVVSDASVLPPGVRKTNTVADMLKDPKTESCPSRPRSKTTSTGPSSSSSVWASRSACRLGAPSGPTSAAASL